MVVVQKCRYQEFDINVTYAQCLIYILTENKKEGEKERYGFDS